jgi:ferredoxin
LTDKQKMIHLKINNIQVEVQAGSSLLQAAAKAGIAVPAMCHNAETEHFTSCMLCLVKERESGALIPSCSVTVSQDMDIITDDPDIAEARKTALELLLSEHVGDCEAPCRIACPAFMDIPRMNRLIAAEKTQEALALVRQDIALPGVMGRICPAPCESVCKRKPIDQAVAICLLKRFSADHAHYNPPPQAPVPTGKNVAIIGSGPAGLSAAYYLQLKGIQANIYDCNEQEGGSLRYQIPDAVLDKKILDKETDIIRQIGVRFNQNRLIDKTAFNWLRREYDAVVVASGNITEAMHDWGLEHNGKQIVVNRSTFQTSLDKVFAIGNANRPVQMAIRSAAQGKQVAIAIQQLFQDKEVKGEQKRFNSTIGPLRPEEFGFYLAEGSNAGRHQADGKGNKGLSPMQAKAEAARCLHCDCRKPDSCKLRTYAEQYHAEKKRFRYAARKMLKKQIQKGGVVYENGKCIKCGICVRLTEKHRETFGFTFIGRGFDTEIDIPFNESLEKALEKTAELVAAACPTGAISIMEKQ